MKNNDCSIKSQSLTKSSVINTGFQSSAINTGDFGVAANMGDWGTAIVSGKNSVAIVIGQESKASGEVGCWIVLTERNESFEIVSVKAIRVDGSKIKANVFYTLKNGEPVEAK